MVTGTLYPDVYAFAADRVLDRELTVEESADVYRLDADRLRRALPYVADMRTFARRAREVRPAGPVDMRGVSAIVDGLASTRTGGSWTDELPA